MVVAMASAVSICFLAILTSLVINLYEECHLLRSTTCYGANVCMCYDYVHVDNSPDISAY